MRFLGLIVICFGLVHAEDPILGVVRGIKCQGCIPDSVLLSIHDPIDGRELEVTIKDSLYNRILTALPGRQLRAKPEGCFYWMVKVKAVKTKQAIENPNKASKPNNIDMVNSSEPKNAANDSMAFTVKESACIPFASRSLGVR